MPCGQSPRDSLDLADDKSSIKVADVDNLSTCLQAAILYCLLASIRSKILISTVHNAAFRSINGTALVGDRLHGGVIYTADERDL